MGNEEGHDHRRWSRLCAEDGVLPCGAASQLLMVLVSAPAHIALAVTALLFVGAWGLIELAGGAAVAVPHGYYLPVLLCAIRFGRAGALLAALVAGVLAGPLTYQDVATATAQEPSEWLTRAVAFVVVGQLVAWLFAHALASVREDADLARADRELRQAIDAGQLFVRYQPVFDAASGRPVAAEALVRWAHPDGERGPASFLPTAERSGRIHQIGDLVLRTACGQAARWQAQARQHRGHAPVVSVNLSVQELAAPDLVDRVRTVLEQTGLAPDRLCLEVTEGALAQDLEGSVLRLGQLGQLGVRVAVDDFGTGYSSLSYVHRFPLDVLKIDRSFVREMEESERARVLVQGIVLMCHQVGVDALLEGVETEPQLGSAVAMGCRLVQGYHLARPETAEQVTARLEASWQGGDRPDLVTERSSG